MGSAVPLSTNLKCIFGKHMWDQLKENKIINIFHLRLETEK